MVRAQRRRQRAAVAPRRGARRTTPRRAAPRLVPSVAGALRHRLRLTSDDAKAVGRLVNVAHELAPADDLAKEALLARQGKVQREHVVDHPPRRQTLEVQEWRDAGMKEMARARRHRVLERPEVLEALGLGPGPGGLHVGLRGGERLGREHARVVAHLRAHDLADLAGDRIDGERRQRRSRRIALPALAVVGVEAEAATDGLALLHENPETTPHLAIEGVHAPRPILRRQLEVLGRREPALVLDLRELARLEERRELGAELALGGLHHRERSQALQRFDVRGSDHVTDRHSARSLLQREVAQAREDEGELLLVIGPPRSLVRTFDEDDPEPARILARQRADRVRQLIVGDEQPAPGRRVGTLRVERAVEDARGGSEGLVHARQRPHRIRGLLRSVAEEAPATPRLAVGAICLLRRDRRATTTVPR